jgi:hypothetical protein
VKRILLTVALLVSTQAHSSMLSSALFSTTKEVAQVATKQAWTCEEVKKAVCTAVVSTLEPMTTFAYDNMSLAAGTTAVVAYVAYKAGKFVNAPIYKPQEVRQVIVVAESEPIVTPMPVTQLPRARR